MRRSEVRAILDVYLGLAITRALEELDALFNLSEQEQEHDRELAAELKEQARSVYAEERALLASDEEFELVWGVIRDDLMREVRALEGMV